MRAVIAPMMADRTFYQAIPGLIAAMRRAMAEAEFGVVVGEVGGRRA